jgi:NADPH2:quinone reductase
MQAAFIERTGPPEVIQVGPLPDPEPAANEVVVRVRACAVNPIDTYVRSGAVAMPLPMPFVVGCDLAGEVLAVGSDVERLLPGDRVWGSNQGLLGRQGTFAELASVDQRWLFPTPDGVSDRDAAAAALVGITAHLGLVTHAGLADGETIFVNGGSGGVGMMVVQIAKRLGARVIATARGEESAAAVAAAGADVVIDRHRLAATASTVPQAVLEAAPAGVDVLWESLREPDLDAAVAMLAEGGRMVLMAGREARPPFPVGPFYLKGARLVGFVMFKAPWQLQAAAAADLNRWLAAGQVRPSIGAIMPLTETAAAHRLQEQGTIDRTGRLTGKIVIEP